MLVALRPPLRFPLPQRKTDREFAFLARRFTPRTIFMEIGGADCKLALRAAGYVERVYAVDVSGQILHSVLVPCNLRLVLCDGVHIPVPEASVDLAWSGGFMDQLHPDDAHEHLQSVRRSLAPGGEYLCRTRGSPRELRQRLLEAGFCAVRCYAGAVRIPYLAAALLPVNALRFAASR
jgi:ubiquinone/menaquinone biosynthesis C-methylase UbiE